MKQEGLVTLESGSLATAPSFVSSPEFSSTTASLLDSVALLSSFAAPGSLIEVNLLPLAKSNGRFRHCCFLYPLSQHQLVDRGKLAAFSKEQR